MLGLFLAASALTACSHPDTQAPADEIRIALPADIRGTNPGVDRDQFTDMVLAHVFEGLVAYDRHFHVAPVLADRFEISADAKTYTFDLRPGVRFQNGAPLTAQDVKWSWERLLDPATHYLCRDWYDGTRGLRIASIETPDSRTVVFHLATPNYLLAEEMASFQCLSAIIHPDSVDAAGRWRRPIGTGPYEIAEWRPGRYVLLKRFPGYASRTDPESGYAGAKRAEAEYLRWQIIPDVAAALAALDSGQVDLVTGVQPTDLAALRQEPDVRIDMTSGLGWYVLLINTDDPLLKDRRIRLAIAHAIDYGALAKAVTFGHARYNPSVVALHSPYHDAAMTEGYGCDPAQAIRLLAQAGYHGQPIYLQANRRYPAMFSNAIIIQSMLRKVGIDARLQVLEWTTQLANVPARRYQLMSFGYSGRPYPLFAYDSFLGSRAVNPWMQWQDAAAMALADRVSGTPDPAMRQQIFDRIHQLMIADVPLINLYDGVVIDAVASRLAGYRSWPAGTPRLWGVSASGLKGGGTL
ncbi:MAG: ABC transporter substrate-binding protein [Acetobacteraceae bacterium]